MAPNPATQNRDRFLRGTVKRELKPILKRAWSVLASFYQMPPRELTTLPEDWILKTRINSWPLACLAIGVAIYAIFLAVAFADGSLSRFSQENLWLRTLVIPITGTYLLSVIPFIRQLLTQTIETFRLLVPDNDRFKRLEVAAYTLNRRREWLAFGFGTVIGWFLLDPQASPYPSLVVYDILGGAFVFGLYGWHVYSALARGKLLSAMYDQVQHLNVFKQTAPFKPILQWGVTVAGVLIGGAIISAIFVPSHRFLDPSIIAIYCSLVFAAVLVFVFTKVPTSLLSQFRMFRAFFLFLFVAVIGTVGFNQLEGWTIEESLYTTVITMMTIGYGDYTPVTPWGQRFTIVLSFVAIGIGGYLLTSVTAYAIEGNFTRFIQGKRVDKQIVQMRDHYILCGAGNLGKQLALELYKSQVPFVVIEQSPDMLEELLREIEIPYIQGDATQDEALQLAGVERATGLIATLRDDKDNVFITLSARSLNDKLRIISRVIDEKNRKKLNNAGANVVISPQVVSGRRMVSEMLHSEVVTFLDEMLQAEQQTGQILRLEEVHIDQIRTPALLERLDQNQLTITDIGQRTDLMVVAIKRGTYPAGDDPYIYTPTGNTVVERGDVLIVIGTPEQRVKLQQEFLSQNSLELWLSKLWG